MHRASHFDDGPEFDDELPDLPIPRPAEGSPEPAPSGPLAAPRLGGGASFTAASEAGQTAQAHPLSPTVGGAASNSDVQPQTVGGSGDAERAIEQLERERIEAERFNWELAARLTSGMLANPARSHASVKDAMAMFDQFLHEMYAYTRIANDFDRGDGARRRREHGEYFHQNGEGGPTTAPQPDAAPSLPRPTQPAPMPGFQALPPNARSRYVPGSMAGSPPPEQASADTDADAA